MLISTSFAHPQQAAAEDSLACSFATSYAGVIAFLAVVSEGSFAKAGDRLFIPLRAEMRRQITPWSGARLDIVPSVLLDDSILYGAFAMAVRLNS